MIGTCLILITEGEEKANISDLEARLRIGVLRGWRTRFKLGMGDRSNRGRMAGLAKKTKRYLTDVTCEELGSGLID